MPLSQGQGEIMHMVRGQLAQQDHKPFIGNQSLLCDQLVFGDVGVIGRCWGWRSEGIEGEGCVCSYREEQPHTAVFLEQKNL